MIKITTESGYILAIGSDCTTVCKGGKSKKFIGGNHRGQAVDYVLGGE